MNFDFRRNANVEVVKDVGKDSKPVAQIIVDDKYVHHFDEKSRVSRALEYVDVNDLQDRLMGGHYFFVDDELVDFRDGNYNGFQHTDDTIQKFIDVIGIDVDNAESRIALKHNQISNDVILGSRWSRGGISVPEYKDGGEFHADLYFGWSPFVHTVMSNFMLWRLLCDNGMRVVKFGFNRKVPVENRWEEHLDIADRQVQNKVNDMAVRRFRQMGKERATVGELQLFRNHIASRLEKPGFDDDWERLSNIRKVIDVDDHLGRVYTNTAMEDSRIAAQLPAHVSTFDLYNMVTEVRTHSSENKKSTNHALDQMANRIVFEREDLTGYTAAHHMTMPRKSTFSNPENAFFGAIN